MGLPVAASSTELYNQSEICVVFWLSAVFFAEGIEGGA